MIPTCTLHTSTCKVQRHGNNLKNTTLAKDLKRFSNDSIHSFPVTYAFSYDLFGKLGSLYEGLNLFVQSMHMFNCDETSNSIVQEPGKFKGGGWVRVVQCLFSDICQQLHIHICISASGYVLQLMMPTLKEVCPWEPEKGTVPLYISFHQWLCLDVPAVVSLLSGRHPSCLTRNSAAGWICFPHIHWGDACAHDVQLLCYQHIQHMFCNHWMSE